MVNFFCIFFIIFSVSFNVSVRSNDEYEVLHFSRDRPLKIFDEIIMKKLGFPKLLYPTATACPAKTEEEDEFNRDNSLNEHSLFVRNIYEVGQSSHVVGYYICHQSYQMSIVYHPSTGNFKFGFEVYYEKSKFDEDKFPDSNRGEFDSIENYDTMRNRIKFMYNRVPSVPGLSRIASIPVAAVSKMMKTSLYLDAERKKELGFLWIDSFNLKFDFAKLRLTQATYVLSVTTRGRKQCDNYDLGEKFFNDLDINDLYNEDNQEEMLQDVVFPPSEIDGKRNEMACESNKKCFEKWSSVPPEILGHLAANPVSCSNLLTVPIWKSTIEDVLVKLDNFLYALSVVIGHPIGEFTVNSGVHGELYLPTNNYFILPIWKKKPIKLVENGIPVPNIIYKFIQYKTKICYPEIKPRSKNEETKTPENEPTIGDPIIEPANPEENENEIKLKNENVEMKHSENEPTASESIIEPPNSDENENKIKHKNENDEMKTPENELIVGDSTNESADTDKKELQASENKLASSDTDHSDNSDKNDELKNQGIRTAPFDIKTAKIMKVNCEYATAAIIVVIHNNPYFNPEKEKICKYDKNEDVCKEAGWEMIRLREWLGEEITSKYIYCCRALDKDVQTKLNIKYDIEEGVGSTSANFDLKAVPLLYNVKINSFVSRDIKDLVIKTYKHIFEGLDYEKTDYDERDALMSSYHTKMQFLQIEAPTDDVKIIEPEEDLEIERPNNDVNESDSSESQSEEEEKSENLTSKDEEKSEKLISKDEEKSEKSPTKYGEESEKSTKKDEELGDKK